MSGPFRRFDDYDFRHAVAIQAYAGAAEDVHRLFALRDDDGRNAWFAARDARGELTGYLDDLDIAATLAHAAAAGRARTRPAAVGLQARYALLTAVLRDTANRMPPGLAVALSRSGLWTREAALAWADLNPDREAGLVMVSDVLEDAPARQDELGVLALTTGAAISDSDNRMVAVAALAERLPPHQRKRALDLIARESNESSRCGGLRQIVPHLPAALLPRAVEIARALHRPEVRAEALAVVAGAMGGPERERGYAEALAALQDGFEGTGPVGFDSPGAQGIERLAWLLPEGLLPRLLEVVTGTATMSRSEHARAVTAVLARVARHRPDWAREQGLKLLGAVPDEVLARVAIAYAEAGRARDALEVWGEIRRPDNAAGAAGSLAPELPGNQLARLIAGVERIDSFTRISALGAIALVPGAPGEVLRRVAEGLPDGRDRRQALLAVVPALDARAVDEILGRGPELAGMVQVAPHLTRAQTRRVLDAARNRKISGLDVRAFEALVVRLAQLGAPEEALARVAELEELWGYDRAKLLSALAPELPTALLPRARALVQPEPEPVARLCTRAVLLLSLPESRCVSMVAEAEQLPDPLDRVRVLTAIIAELPADHEGRPAAALLRAVEASADHRSLDRRAVLAAAWRHLGEGPPAGALAVARGLQDLDDRFSALYQLIPAYAEAAAAVVDMVVADPGAGPLVMAREPSPQVRRRVSDAIVAIGDHATMATAAVALAGVVPRGSAAAVVARLATVDDPRVRLSALHALVPCISPALRRRVARDELGRWEDQWHRGWDTIVGVGLIARCDREAAAALVAEGTAAVRELPAWEDRVNAATLLADAFEKMIDRWVLDEVLDQPVVDDVLLVGLIRHLDGDGVRRLRDHLSQLVPGYRVHEFLAELASRALRLGDEPLALECLAGDGDVYLIEAAIASIAEDLPHHLIEPAAAIAGEDGTALGALARRAAVLGDGALALALADRPSDDRRAHRLAELAPLIPEESVPALADRARGAGPEAAGALTALVSRVPRSERGRLVTDAVAATAELRFAQAETRVQLLHRLTPELARLPVADLMRLWGDALGRSRGLGRGEVLHDIRGFAPALVRRFGPEVALALDDAIAVAGGDHWP